MWPAKACRLINLLACLIRRTHIFGVLVLTDCNQLHSSFGMVFEFQPEVYGFKTQPGCWKLLTTSFLRKEMARYLQKIVVTGTKEHGITVTVLEVARPMSVIWQISRWKIKTIGTSLKRGSFQRVSLTPRIVPFVSQFPFLSPTFGKLTLLVLTRGSVMLFKKSGENSSFMQQAQSYEIYQKFIHTLWVMCMVTCV